MANCRVKITMSRVETPVPIFGSPSLISLGFSRTEVLMIRYFRSAASTSSWESSVSSPDWISPPTVRPFQTYTGTIDSPAVR